MALRGRTRTTHRTRRPADDAANAATGSVVDTVAVDAPAAAAAADAGTGATDTVAASSAASAISPTHASPEERAAATALRFLTALYGETPEGHLTLWTSRNKHTAWPDTLAAAAAEAVRLARRDDVYFGVGLRRAVLDIGRGTARDVLSLPALWADLDVKAPAHKAHQLPPDKASAMAILADFPLPASAIIDSGYGYHAYWFLDEPYQNKNAGQTKGLLVSLGQALVVIAERHGWKIDTSVFEPARVLRVPGTFNRKERRPRPVRIERLDATARYSADRLLATAETVIVDAQTGGVVPTVPPPTAPQGGTDPSPNSGGGFPEEPQDAAAPRATSPSSPKVGGGPLLGDAPEQVGAARVDYAQTALRGEADELAATGTGGRNTKLNDAAFRLGTLAGAYSSRGWPGLSESEAWDALWSACQINGLAQDRHNGGEARCRTTFESGWNAGMGQPRRLPADLGEPVVPVLPAPTAEATPTAEGAARSGDVSAPAEDRGQSTTPPETQEPAPQRIRRCHFAVHEPTDLGNASRLAELCRDELRRCEPLKQWYVWSGIRWRADDVGFSQTLAKRVARSIAQEAHDAGKANHDELAKNLERWARASCSRGKIEAMLGLATDELAVRVNDLDRDPWLLNCKNGTVDLRTGELQPHRPADLITRYSPVDFVPGAHLGTPNHYLDAAEMWQDFLGALTGQDADLACYVQRAVGLTLIGAPLESVLFFAYGPPGTGKSTFLDVLLLLLGDYAQKVTGDVFMTRFGNAGLRPEIAQVRGTRLVVCDETNKGRRLDVGLVNDLTGSAQITARALYQNAVTFPRTFTPWIASNFRPEIVEGDDSGIWRRLHEMPFDHPVSDTERKRNLASQLVRQAGPAILAWAVEGALVYQREGLGTVQRVAEASADFKWQMNPLNEWLEERCERHAKFWTETTDLYRDYHSFCELNGERPVRRREMTDRLQAMGFEMYRLTRGRGFNGLRLRGSRHASEIGPIGYPQTAPNNAEYDGYDGTDGDSENLSQNNSSGAHVSSTDTNADTATDATTDFAEVLGNSLATVITVIPDPAEREPNPVTAGAAP